MASEAARRYAAKLGVALPASLPATPPPPALVSVATVATSENPVATEVATRKPAENCYLLDVVATVATVATNLENDRAALKIDISDSPHIAAEPDLPPPGSPERAQIDRRQALMVAGLLAGFHAHRRSAT